MKSHSEIHICFIVTFMSFQCPSSGKRKRNVNDKDGSLTWLEGTGPGQNMVQDSTRDQPATIVAILLK